MHIQPQFRETREAVLHDLIRQHPLATVVVQHDELMVNHFPLVLESVGEHVGGHGILQGHIPRSNPLCAALADGHPAVAVFHGPEGYVSPSWYPSKHEHGKAVPTWNYVVVHAHGIAKAVHERGWLLAHLNALTDQQESGQARPWQVADAPPEFTEQMLGGIVGIEVRISAIVGKWKVSQNRPESDQLGVAAGLRNRGSSDDLALAAMLPNAFPGPSSV